MALRAYILIESAIGKARAVHDGVHRLAIADAKILSVETVSGPADVVATVETDDLNSLGRLVTEGVQRVHGVKRTITCTVIELD